MSVTAEELDRIRAAAEGGADITPEDVLALCAEVRRLWALLERRDCLMERGLAEAVGTAFRDVLREIDSA